MLGNELAASYGCHSLSRVRLSKRRGKTAKSAMNSRLVVKHREMTEDEMYAQVQCTCAESWIIDNFLGYKSLSSVHTCTIMKAYYESMNIM